MTLDASASMRRSPSLKFRIEASASAHGQDDTWVDRNLRTLAADPTWISKWATAAADAAAVGDNSPNLGVRTDVISDDMIDTAVAALIEQQGQQPSPTDQQLAALAEQVQLQAQTIQTLQQTVTMLQAAAATETPAS